MLLVVPFSLLYSPLPCTPPPTYIPTFSSCPWVILISSLASTFPTLFLPSPCLFSTYHLCYLFSVPFLPLFPSHSPADYPPCDLHFCDSFLFQLFAQFAFVFVLGVVVNNWYVLQSENYGMCLSSFYKFHFNDVKQFYFTTNYTPILLKQFASHTFLIIKRIK